MRCFHPTKTSKKNHASTPSALCSGGTIFPIPKRQRPQDFFHGQPNPRLALQYSFSPRTNTNPSVSARTSSHANAIEHSTAESPLPGIVGAVAAVLGRVVPPALDGPGAEALVVGVVAGKVAVLDETADNVAAAVVDVFVLTH